MKVYENVFFFDFSKNLKGILELSVKEVDDYVALIK